MKMGGATRYDLDDAAEWVVDCIRLTYGLKPGARRMAAALSLRRAAATMAEKRKKRGR